MCFRQNGRARHQRTGNQWRAIYWSIKYSLPARNIETFPRNSWILLEHPTPFKKYAFFNAPDFLLVIKSNYFEDYRNGKKNSCHFCDRPLSVVNCPCVRACVRASLRPCVNNFFKQHLLWNHLLDFDQTSQEWSLGGPLSKLLKPFQLVA